MRAHGHIDYMFREPYIQSESVQKAVKEALTLRYDLSHYLYTQFYLSSKNGSPIMKPLWMEFPDFKDDGLDSQFMFGENFLVAPKLKLPDINKEDLTFLE